jgi:hypothetical protein
MGRTIKIKLSTNQLLMLKDLLMNDMEKTSEGGNGYYDDYGDVNLMQYYLDRAKMLVKVVEGLGL